MGTASAQSKSPENSFHGRQVSAAALIVGGLFATPASAADGKTCVSNQHPTLDVWTGRGCFIGNGDDIEATDLYADGRRTPAKPPDPRTVIDDGPPRCCTGVGRRRAREGAGQRSRCTLCWAAWARGRMTIRSMLTCEGRVTAHSTVSATSSAVSGSATPS